MGVNNVSAEHNPGLLRVGIAGAGTFGGYHGWKVHDHPMAVLTGVFDQDIAQAQTMAQKFGSVAFGDFDEFLNSIDALIITAPARYHGSLGLDALGAGKHVLVEKPIALSLADADAMIAAAAHNELILQVGHQERFVAQALGLFALPQRPRKIVTRRCMPMTGRGEDVSVVMDLMIHDLDLVAQFISSGQIDGLDHMAGDDDVGDPFHETAVRIVDRQSGLIAECTASRRSTGRERALTLVFDQGEIHLDFLTRTIRNSSGFALQECFRADDEIAQQSLALRDPLAFGFDHFVTAIANRTPPPVTGQQARAALALALRVEQVCAAVADIDRPERRTRAQTTMSQGAK